MAHDVGQRRGRGGRAAVGAAAVLAVLVVSGPGAGALPPVGGGPVRHNQLFDATVNGNLGLSGPVTVATVCPGPVSATGHPAPGQTLGVFMPAAITTKTGDTGTRGRSIEVFFGTLPPTPAADAGPVVFKRYGTKKLPTSEVVPCNGTGHIYFVPLPMSPGSERIVSVTVDYGTITAG